MQTIPFRLHDLARAIFATTGRRVVVAAIGLAVAGTATLVLSSQDPARPNKDATSSATAVAARSAGVTVSLVNPVPTQLARSIPATGTVAARDELIIGSDATGVRLTEVLVEVGTVVHKGQLLARADDALLRAELSQREAQIRQAHAELAQAQDNLDRAEKVKDSGVYSAEQLQTRRNNTLAALAKFDLAQAQRRELEVRIAQTRVFAPTAGVISKKLATVGQVVQPGNELFRLIRDGQLEWMAELPAHSMALVAPGASARVRLDGSEPVDGTVRLVAPTLDAGTRNGMVYVALPKTAALKAGTHAKGEILVGQARALALPESAVITRDGYPYVFIVGGDSVARMKRIETGNRLRGLVEVMSGLSVTDQVVGTGAGFVKDGEPVRVAPLQAAVSPARPPEGAQPPLGGEARSARGAPMTSQQGV